MKSSARWHRQFTFVPPAFFFLFLLPRAASEVSNDVRLLISSAARPRKLICKQKKSSKGNFYCRHAKAFTSPQSAFSFNYAASFLPLIACVPYVIGLPNEPSVIPRQLSRRLYDSFSLFESLKRRREAKDQFELSFMGTFCAFEGVCGSYITLGTTLTPSLVSI